MGLKHIVFRDIQWRLAPSRIKRGMHASGQLSTVAVFNTLGGSTSQTGKESGSGWSVCVCEQVSARARQTRSPIPAPSQPPASKCSRDTRSISRSFTLSVHCYCQLILCANMSSFCPLLNELAQPGSSSRGKGDQWSQTTHWGCPEDPAWVTPNHRDNLPNRDVNGSRGQDGYPEIGDTPLNWEA